MIFRIDPAVPGDASTLLRDVRPEDITEWEASGVHYFGLDAIRRAIRNSTECWAVKGDGNTHALIGVDKNQECDITWLIATNTCARNGMALMFRFHEFQVEFFKRWPTTRCFSDDRNPVHHRWLEYLGYDLVRVIPYGPHSLPFREYWRHP